MNSVVQCPDLLCSVGLDSLSSLLLNMLDFCERAVTFMLDSMALASSEGSGKSSTQLLIFHILFTFILLDSRNELEFLLLINHAFDS